MKEITIADFSDQTLFEVASLAYMKYMVIEPSEAPDDIVDLIRESAHLDRIDCRDVDKMGLYLFYDMDIDDMSDDESDSSSELNLYGQLIDQMIERNKRAWTKWHALC